MFRRWSLRLRENGTKVPGVILALIGLPNASNSLHARMVLLRFFRLVLTGPLGATQSVVYLGLLPACFNVFAKRDRVQLIDRTVLSRLG